MIHLNEEVRKEQIKKQVRGSIEETLTCFDFPAEYWPRIRTSNVIDRLNQESRRRIRVAGPFPDGSSALIRVCARLCHAAGTQWCSKKHMNMRRLEVALEDAFLAG